MSEATIGVEPAPRAMIEASPPDAPGSLADVLDRILHRGVSLEGNVTITVAEVDLLFLDLRVLLASVDTVWPKGRPQTRTTPRADQPTPRVSPPSPALPALAPPTPIDDFATPAGTGAGSSERPGQAGAKPLASPAAGLVRLVLTLVKLLHEVLERQAVRRMAGGQLTAAQIENVGLAMYAQAREIERLRRQFGFSDRELDMQLGLSSPSI